MPEPDDFTVELAECLVAEAMRDKFGRGVFTVHKTDGDDPHGFELLVTPEYGEAAQAQRYRVTVEKID